MNTRLIFLGFLAVITALYLKVQADGVAQEHIQLNYFYSLLCGAFGLVAFYVAWRPLKIKQTIVIKATTALYLILLLSYIAIKYFQTTALETVAL